MFIINYLKYCISWCKAARKAKRQNKYNGLTELEEQYIRTKMPYCTVSFTDGTKKTFLNPQDEYLYLMPIFNDPQKIGSITSMATYLPNEYNKISTK